MSDAQPARLLEVLLVEDNDDDAAWTIESLDREGVRCSVSRVEDGEEALAFLRREGKHAAAPPPALVLLDLTLPSKGGLEVLRDMRKGDDPVLQQLPVVIMTVSKEFGDAREALNLGVTHYINKPVKLEEFIASVKAITPDPKLSEKQREFLEAWAREIGRFA
jgi:chemotaxis family two-component system response regulator Rcp1